MAQIKIAFQLLLGAFLTSAGTSHLGSNRQEFQAQVPTWLPLDPDFVVITSGLVEIALGLSLIITLLIFPGNINQYLNQIDAFGLDTDQKRLLRLFFQPPLVIWAIWSTGAGTYLRKAFKR